MATSFPPTLAQWAKWIWTVEDQLTPPVPPFFHDVLDYFGVIEHAAHPTPDTWDHVEALFGDPTDPVRANQAVTTFDVVNITGGNVDNTWTKADFDTVEAGIAGMC